MIALAGDGHNRSHHDTAAAVTALVGTETRRYTWAMIDLFAVPAGTVPQVDPEHGEDHSGSFPAEMEDYLGKWVAVRRGQIVAVADTEADVHKALGDECMKSLPGGWGITLFHVPSSVVAAR
jgi:hypothetical protein